MTVKIHYNCLSPVEQEQLPECIINSDTTINSKEVNYRANIMEVCFYLKYNFKTSLKKKILFIKYISRLIGSLKLMNSTNTLTLRSTTARKTSL